MPGLHSFLTLAQAAVDVAKAAETTTTQPAITPLQLVIVVAVVFGIPLILGPLIANALRMKDVAMRISIVLMAVFFALAPFGWRIARGEDWRKAIRLGIDLAGGTNLVYEVDYGEAVKSGKIGEGEQLTKDSLDKMVAAIQKRLNPSGAEEITVRRVGNNRIEVIIPGADREVIAQKKGLITRLGSLEFALLANDKDHPQIIAEGRALRPDQNEVRRKDEQGNLQVVAAWKDVAADAEVGGDRTATREVTRVDEDGKSQQVQQFLVVIDPKRQITGRYLLQAAPTTDQTGQLAVSFRFNATGGNLFGNLTTRYQPDRTDGFHRQLAILLDNKIESAPRINEPIRDSGIIQGQFTKAEVDELVNVLNAGALEVPLKPQPVTEFSISPLLGADVQTSGITAIIISAVFTFLFMLVYYRVAGVIACLCLLLNLILVVGAMSFISATFTLPGLAGLVLTIGMAVDANILIYERMREELERGGSLRMAVQNGFEKAFSTIIDSNLTSLITAVILYLIGSDQIRGFAVSLFIGLVMSLFTALYFGRLAFDIIERKRLVKTLSMMRLIGETKFDFLATRKLAFLASVVVIGIGMATLVARGSSNMDIDFTGGTMVTFEFEAPQQTAAVRTQLEEKFGPTISLEQLTTSPDDQSSSEGATRFRMRTTDASQPEVVAKINEALSEPEFALRRVTATIGEVETIAAAADEATISDAERRFASGHRAALTFSGPVREGTISEYVVAALEAIPGTGDAPRYQFANTLVAVDSEETEGDETAGVTSATVRVTRDVSAEDFATALATVEKNFADAPLFEEVNSFDTSVGYETQRDAAIAIILSLIATVGYIWFRFEKVYFGYAAVVALAHDVLVTLGAIAVAAYLSRTPVGAILGFDDFKINMGLIASLLTIVGYSLNDTIVIFDRIREIKGKNPNITYDMINLSVNQTLSRTILTALTVLIVVVILYALGGDGIHGFAFSMIVGTVTGAYSTVYIANPVLLWLVTRKPKVSMKAAA